MTIPTVDTLTRCCDSSRPKSEACCSMRSPCPTEAAVMRERSEEEGCEEEMERKGGKEGERGRERRRVVGRKKYGREEREGGSEEGMEGGREGRIGSLPGCQILFD